MTTQISGINALNSVSDQTDSLGASSNVVRAIQSASSRTGVDFSYLMKKASQESSFDPTAKSTASSATGLFQFTSQTWLSMVKKFGDQYGLGDYASKISADASGHLRVSDPVARQAILALRKDPAVSAEMAGELDKQNLASLHQNVGGKIGQTELYLAHFLGASGAGNFISELRANPTAEAASVLPTAAASNPSVFYDKEGQPRTLQQIYQHFAQKFGSGSTQVASVSKAPRAVHAATQTSAIASTASLTSNMASLVPASYGSSLSNTNAARASMSSLRGVTMASAGNASTMFNTMVLGQMQGTGLTAPSPLGALSAFDAKRKSGHASFSDVV